MTARCAAGNFTISTLTRIWREMPDK